MSQVVDEGASYKIVANNFEYCPLCHRIKTVYSRTVLANVLVKCGTVQLEIDLTEKVLERLLRSNREFLGFDRGCSHTETTVVCQQQAVEEKGPTEPSALTFGNVFIARNSPQRMRDSRRAGEEIFVPDIQETAHRHAELLVTGRL